MQICFCPKECDGKSKNRKPVEFRENILLEGKNGSKVVEFTIEPLSIEGPDMVIFDILQIVRKTKCGKKCTKRTTTSFF